MIKYVFLSLSSIASNRYLHNSWGLQIVIKMLSSVTTRAENDLKRPFTVFVEGNIGSGKTTFFNNFSDLGAHIVAEPVDLWRNLDGHNLLGSLYKDSKRWAFLFQSYVQLTMVNTHLSSTQLPLKMMERSIHSARLCFVENLYRNKTITDAEFRVLDHWYQWIKSYHNVGGDLIVYLRTKPEVVYERMRERNRQEESCVPFTYLQQLHDLHEEWLMGSSGLSMSTPVIVVDGNQDLMDMEKEFMKVKSHIFQQPSLQTQPVSV